MFKEIASIAERGRIDMLFFGDGTGIRPPCGWPERTGQHLRSAQRHARTFYSADEIDLDPVRGERASVVQHPGASPKVSKRDNDSSHVRDA